MAVFETMFILLYSFGSMLPIYLLVISPLLLIPWNIGSFICCLWGKEEKTSGKYQTKYVEVLGIFLGLFCTFLVPPEIAWGSSWWEAIDALSLYPPVAAEYSFTFEVLCLFAFLGYLFLRFRSIETQPPLLSVFSISSLYVGIFLCTIWCIQIVSGNQDAFFHLILPLNVILIYVKTILLFVRHKTATLEIGVENNTISLPYLKLFLKKAEDYPKLAFLGLLPFLGISVGILMLFGQKPDSLVAMWTETAEWNLSQQIPPPRLDHTGHYLCTVAVCGSPTLVKPLWVGERGGEKILVNRQLAIANGFEQILEEKTPQLHRVIRSIYDKTGYPISRHITTPFWSNVTYLLMKPLEWFFLLVLYLVDVTPEQRIASQYRGDSV